MSMDALTKAAIHSLTGDILPRLNKALSLTDEKGESDDRCDLLFLLSESREMLLLVEKWATNGSDAAPSFAREAPALAPNNEKEMSDDEARRLLAQMDGQGTPAPAPKSDKEMSDDEARRLLAQMDGQEPPASAPKSDKQMSDDEARRLLTQMDGQEPPAPAPKSDKQMSDDEARKLLAQMDGQETSSAPAPTLSDEDASMIMVEMVDVAVPAEAKPTQTMQPAQAAVSHPQQVKPSDKTPASSPAPSTGGEEFECTEIDEWEKNDFQTDPDMVNDFIASSDELMQALDDQILLLEQQPGSKEIIESIFRAAHTLKGAGGMFGFRAIERVMHRMESLFDKIRKGQMTPNSDIIDLVFRGLDTLRALLGAVKDKKPCGIKTGEIVKHLTMAAAGKVVSVGRSGGGAAPSDKQEQVAKEATDSGATRTETGAVDGAAAAAGTAVAKQKDPSASTIRVDLDRLDALVNLIGELVIDRTKFVSIEEELRTHHPNVKLSGNIAETVQLFGRHMNEIQDIIMKVRMVPIGNTFAKYPRIVRDLSKSLDKKINLHLSGESAEMDKTLVESIGDPLVHLIRNSCDHGVESPADRVKAGKDPTGNIYLSARQEGNSIAIEIRDDGKGINPDIIRRKAIEKGVISAEAKLSRRDILNLIFEPGFSTAEKITNVSGRGVGMDVVKKAIMKLKGMLDIESEVGKGTTLTIQLPLTLAIVQSLLVSIKNEILAIPLSSVIESIRINDSDIQKVGDVEIIKLRNKVLPLMHLDKVLDLDAKRGTMSDMIAMRKNTLATSRRLHSDPNRKKHFVVVVGQQDRPFGIVVDYLLNQQEMVIKSMGSIMNDIPAVAGGSVLGNGDVVLVLDILKLQDAISSKTRGIAA